MKIEILYFGGCPNHEPAVALVREVLAAESLQAAITETEVADEAAAQAQRFLGSPSIRVNGLDVEPEMRSSRAFGMSCRTYVEAGKRTGVPPREWIRQAVREAAGGKHRLLFGGSMVAALAASLCCILPVTAAVTGLGVSAASGFFGQWRPYLLGLAGVFLAAGLVSAARGCRKGCGVPPMNRWNFLVLGSVTALVLGLAVFPTYSGPLAAVFLRQRQLSVAAPASSLVTASLLVPDMDCPACAVRLSAELEKLPGVAAARADFPTRRVVVTYDPGRQNPAAFHQTVTAAGYHPRP